MATFEGLFASGSHGLPALPAPTLTRFLALLVLATLLTLLTTSRAQDTGGEIDYVIVGGGTAGCVMAARLCTRLPDAQIVLLERGQERNQTEEELVRAMRRTFDSWLNPNLAEVWLSTPNPGLGGRPEPIITGRTLGGTSAINAGQWTTPALKDVAAWGFDGLDADAAKKLYERAADILQVRQPPNGLRHEYFDPWLEAAKKQDFEDKSPLELKQDQEKDNVDTNAVTALGNGRRRDSCTAYLTQAVRNRCRGNLQLRQAAVATEVVVQDGVAVAVRYRQYNADGTAFTNATLRARREVISCAGPYGSPNLLQLSGIGPDAFLSRAGVPQVVDLPVGASVQGRPVGRIVDVYTSVPLAPENNPHLVFSDRARRTFNSGIGGVLGVTITAINGVLIEEQGLIAGSTATPSDVIGQPLFLLTCLLNPTTRGTLRLAADAATDPLAPPDVNLNLLGTAGETADMQRCLTRLGRVNDEVREKGELGLVSVDPGPAGIDQGYLERTTTNSYHFVGGCAAGTVVDGRFRVRSVRGLRVVDASVIPEIPRYAGIMASVYALAEHAAGLVVVDHGRYGEDDDDDLSSDSGSGGSFSSDSDDDDDDDDDDGDDDDFLYVEEEDSGTLIRGYELIDDDDLVEVMPYLLDG
eukprot:jgi/Ulvmu1/9696/UM055_0034.1